MPRFSNVFFQKAYGFTHKRNAAIACVGDIHLLAAVEKRLCGAGKDSRPGIRPEIDLCAEGFGLHAQVERDNG